MKIKNSILKVRIFIMFVRDSQVANLTLFPPTLTHLQSSEKIHTVILNKLKRLASTESKLSTCYLTIQINFGFFTQHNTRCTFRLWAKILTLFKKNYFKIFHTENKQFSSYHKAEPRSVDSVLWAHNLLECSYQN